MLIMSLDISIPVTWWPEIAKSLAYLPGPQPISIISNFFLSFFASLKAKI